MSLALGCSPASADAIDFQIEADFAGLMNPGLPNAATYAATQGKEHAFSADLYMRTRSLAGLRDRLSLIGGSLEGRYRIERELGKALRLLPNAYRRWENVSRCSGSHPQDPMIDSCGDQRT